MSNLSLKLSQDSRHTWHIWVCLGKLNGQMVLTKFLQRVRKGLGKGRGELMPSLGGGQKANGCGGSGGVQDMIGRTGGLMGGCTGWEH